VPTAPGVSGVVALGVADGVVVGAEGDVVVGGVVVVEGGVVVVGGAVVLGGAVEDGGVVLLGGAAVGAPVADVGAPVMPDEPVEPAPPIVGLARTNDGAAAVAPDAPDCTQPVTVTIWVEPDVAGRVVGD
jgi:hypothetical protein